MTTTELREALAEYDRCATAMSAGFVQYFEYINVDAVHQLADAARRWLAHLESMNGQEGETAR